MTGHQPIPPPANASPATKRRGVDIPALARAVGVKRVRTADAYHLLDLEKAIRDEIEATSPR